MLYKHKLLAREQMKCQTSEMFLSPDYSYTIEQDWNMDLHTAPN